MANLTDFLVQHDSQHTKNDILRMGAQKVAVSGTVYFASDTGDIFVGLSDGESEGHGSVLEVSRVHLVKFVNALPQTTTGIEMGDQFIVNSDTDKKIHTVSGMTGSSLLAWVESNPQMGDLYVDIGNTPGNRVMMFNGSSYMQVGSKLINNLTTATAGQGALDARQGKALDEKKEDVANRVDAWQEEPDDNHYPSEKLVYDNLATLDEAQTVIIQALDNHVADDDVHVTTQAKEHWNAVYADWNEHDWVDASELAAVATTGSYNDLVDKPVFGTAAYRNVGENGGVAELDENGKVPSTQLPSYVDDVIEFTASTDHLPDSDSDPRPSVGQVWYTTAAFGAYRAHRLYTVDRVNPVVFVQETEPEQGKIYVRTHDNTTWRWSGSRLVEIANGGLVLGETSSTAYRGDRGKAAYDHSLDRGNPHGTQVGDIPGLVDALAGKAPASHQHSASEISGLGTAATMNTGYTDETIPVNGETLVAGKFVKVRNDMQLGTTDLPKVTGGVDGLMPYAAYTKLQGIEVGTVFSGFDNVEKDGETLTFNLKGVDLSDYAEADHEHGNINKDGVLVQSETIQKSVPVVTNATGSIVAGAYGTQDQVVQVGIGGSAAAGTSGALARADHKHTIPQASAGASVAASVAGAISAEDIFRLSQVYQALTWR